MESVATPLEQEVRVATMCPGMALDRDATTPLEAPGPSAGNVLVARAQPGSLLGTGEHLVLREMTTARTSRGMMILLSMRTRRRLSLIGQPGAN
jgi:hypothetical protein